MSDELARRPRGATSPPRSVTRPRSISVPPSRASLRPSARSTRAASTSRRCCGRPRMRAGCARSSSSGSPRRASPRLIDFAPNESISIRRPRCSVSWCTKRNGVGDRPLAERLTRLLHATHETARVLDAGATSLVRNRDILESDVAQYLFVCTGCGRIAEAATGEACPLCGALPPEFAGYFPFFMKSEENLGRRRPAEIVEMLRGDGDRLAEAVEGPRRGGPAAGAGRRGVEHRRDRGSHGRRRDDLQRSAPRASEPRPGRPGRRGQGPVAPHPRARVARPLDRRDRLDVPPRGRSSARPARQPRHREARGASG